MLHYNYIIIKNPILINSVVEIHTKELKNDYLPKLGKQIMHSYYRKFVTNNVLIGCAINFELVGFVAFQIQNFGYKKIILQNILNFIKANMNVKVFLQTIAFLLGSKRQMYPEISFIAVKKNNRNKKIGSNLLKAAQKFAKNKGFTEVYVKTNINNYKALKFYKKNGFFIENIEYRIAEKFYCMRKNND